MRLIGGFICFLAFFGLSEQITFNGLVWFGFGMFIALLPEILSVITHKVKQ